MEPKTRPSGKARKDADEYEFIPNDPSKPVLYGFCLTPKEAADFAETNGCGMYRKILTRGV